MNRIKQARLALIGRAETLESDSSPGASAGKELQGGSSGSYVGEFTVIESTSDLEAWLAPKGWRIEHLPLQTEELIRLIGPRTGIQLTRPTGDPHEPSSTALVYPGETLVWDGSKLRIQQQEAQRKGDGA